MTGITDRANSLRDSANSHLWMGGRAWRAMEASEDPLAVSYTHLTLPTKA